MGWIIFFAGLIAWATRPNHDANGGAAVRALVVMWCAWALVVVAMIAGLVIVEVAR